jgi:hypothetical protein
MTLREFLLDYSATLFPGIIEDAKSVGLDFDEKLISSNSRIPPAFNTISSHTGRLSHQSNCANP